MVLKMNYKYCFLVIISILLVGCASQRYAKQAFKNEQAGLFEDAAELYLKSFNAKKNNIDAKLGAKKNAQISLDQKLSRFHKAYIDGDSNKGVSLFLDAKKYYNRFTSAGISLDFPEEYEEEFNDVKQVHLAEKYRQGLQLFNEEKFYDSEQFFNAIRALDSNYKDVNQLWKVAHYEPLYRQAKTLLSNRSFRKSHELFSKITNEIGQYKEANQFMQDAFDAAVLPISVGDFAYSSQPYFSSKLRSAIIGSLLNSNNKFLKIIDNSSLNQTGSSLNAKAILSAQVLRIYGRQGNLSRQIVRAYYKDAKEVVKDGLKTTLVDYTKIEYAEFSQTNTVSCVFKYQLVSSETGEILVSDEISITNDDFIRFAEFGGDYANIVPGFWKSKIEISPEDFIRDNYTDINNLRKIFKAKTAIKTIDALENEIVSEISLQTSMRISLYNPEK